MGGYTLQIPQDATVGEQHSIAIPEGASIGQPKADEGFLSKAWKTLNTPVADLISKVPGVTKRAILSAMEQGAGYAPGTLSPENLAAQAAQLDPDHPNAQALKTFVAGTIGDSADMAAGFSSPLSIATAAGGAATKIPGAIGKVATALTGAAGAGFAAKGAHDVAEAGTANTPEAWEQRLQGGAMMAGGAAGAGEAVRDVAPGMAASASDALKANAEKQYSQALNPTKERTKFLSQKRTPEMIRRGITFNDAGELAETAGEKASAATSKLNDVYDNLPANRQSPTQPMIDALEQYKKGFQDTVPDGQGGTKTINIDDNAVNAASALQKTISQYGDTISPQSMRKVRQIFDESVARAGGYEGRNLAEGSILDARKEAATAIRQQLAKDNPELVPLNNEVNFWLDVQKIAKETAQRKVGQQGGIIVPMAKRAGQVAGGTVGFEMGGPAGAAAGYLTGGELAGNIAAATRSAKWRTVSAVAKNTLADALAAGNFMKAQGQIRFIGQKYGIPLTSAVASQQTQETEQPNP